MRRGGVQAQTETVWQQCRKYHVPAMAFVNKLDRVGADFESVLGQIKTRLEVTPLLCRSHSMKATSSGA